MNFQNIEIKSDLPIAAYEKEICEKFQNSSNMIIIGETGSGKTTQIPVMLLKTLSKFQDLENGKIAVTEPRRLAAVSVSRYVASNLGEEIGGNVGYKVRFDEKLSQKSILLFMTDGIMLREMQLDPLLMQYSVIMVDEAHERNINSDFLIGLLVDIQKQRKRKGLIPLKIIVTSATLEKEKFEKFFNKLKDESLFTIEVPGRLFPITSTFSDHEVIDYEFEAAQKVDVICSRNTPGDILIFMPGKREIEKTKQEIEKLPKFEFLNLEIISVHGNLPIEQQNEIFKDSDRRKVVIATNIAETSLTVPGVVYVIDSGLVKQMEFNPHTGMNSLVTKPHARKGLEQRKGRAGRIEPGFYFPLFTKQSYTLRQEFQTPEILRTSLSQMVLIMKKVGVHDIFQFNFIDQPDKILISKAVNDLKRYGALDQNENLTPKGEMMARLPLDPKLSNLILEADKNKCLDSISTMCSFLELKPVILSYTLDDFVEAIVKILEDESEGNAEKQEFSDEESTRTLSYEIKQNLNIEEIDTENIIEVATELFEEYNHKINRLEYYGSDFFTFLKIFSQWNKNNRVEQWANDNFLSVEVLQEASNIKADLIEIIEKAGYITKDKEGKDLYFRIEKTLINAFKYNVLMMMQNRSYKNLVTKDINIRLHSYSVLLNNKPQYAVSYEVIEINDINSGPKLSAKVLHTLEEETMKHYFPEVIKHENKRKFQSRRRFKFKNSRSRKHHKRR